MSVKPQMKAALAAAGLAVLGAAGAGVWWIASPPKPTGGAQEELASKTANELSGAPAESAPDATVAAAEAPDAVVDAAQAMRDIADRIRAHRAGGKTYYHFEYELTPNNTLVGQELEAMGGARARMARVSDGGQFEVLTPKAAFPVPAPNCRDYVVIRMPWTDPTAPDAQTHIAAKRGLWERISAMKRDGGSVTVALELNPYIEVLRENPLSLQLTQCNVYFRQSAGAYVAHADEATP